MARPTGPSDGTSVGAPSDGVAAAAAQASRRRQHPTDAARQSTLDHRPNGPLAKKIRLFCFCRSTLLPLRRLSRCHSVVTVSSSSFFFLNLSRSISSFTFRATVRSSKEAGALDRTDRSIQGGSKMTDPSPTTGNDNQLSVSPLSSGSICPESEIEPSGSVKKMLSRQAYRSNCLADYRPIAWLIDRRLLRSADRDTGSRIFNIPIDFELSN